MRLLYPIVLLAFVSCGKNATNIAEPPSGTPEEVTLDERKPRDPPPYPVPLAGTIRLDKVQVLTREKVVVSGTFDFKEHAGPPMMVYIRVMNTNGVIVASGAAPAKTGGNTATFEATMNAPVEPGSFSVVASLGKHEISRTSITVLMEQKGE